MVYAGVAALVHRDAENNTARIAVLQYVAQLRRRRFNVVVFRHGERESWQWFFNEHDQGVFLIRILLVFYDTRVSLRRIDVERLLVVAEFSVDGETARHCVYRLDVVSG